MKSRRPRLLLAIAVLVIAPLFGPAASMQQAPKRPSKSRTSLRGRRSAPRCCRPTASGSATGSRRRKGTPRSSSRRVRADKALRFPIGEVPAGGGGGGRGGAGGGADVRRSRFRTTGSGRRSRPIRRAQAAQRLRRQRRPIQSSVTVVNLASGEKKEYPKIRRFAFSGESAGWIALHRFGPDAPGGGGGGGGAAAAARARARPVRARGERPNARAAPT